MNRVLKKFIDGDSISEILRENFDYDFNLNSDYDKFEYEYKKFMWIYSGFFFNDGILKTSINSYYIMLEVKDLEQIFKLYRYAFNNDFKEKYVLGEFLMTYYNSINNINYKRSGPGTKPVNEYKSVERKYKLENSVYQELLDVSYDFYYLLVKFIVENDEFLYDEIIDRIRTNIKSDDKFNILVSMLFCNDKNVWTLVSYDNEIDKHIKIYDNYIKKELTNFNAYKYPSRIIFALDKKNKLKRSIFNIVINDIVDKVNDLHDKVLNNSIDIIRDIASIDNFLTQINDFINKLHTINDKQKIKLKQCRNNLMTIKRYVLSDEKRINDSLQCFTHETKIETKKIDRVVNSICENIFTLYANSKVDFDEALFEALKSYSEHPLLDLTSNYTLDSEHQTYYIFNEENVSDFFKEHYEKVGKEYTIINSNKLRNVLSNGYYNQLLKYLRRTFIFKQQMICDFLHSRDKFGEVIQKFKDLLGLTTNNEYSIVAHNVIEIEIRIIDILKQKNLNVDSDAVCNMVELAKYYKGNKIAFNGLVYINYILYEESGLKIRNNIAHGNLINQNLDVELITTFSAIILLQWLLNEE